MRPATLPSRSGRRRRRSRGHVDLLEGRAAAGLARVREIHEQVTGSRAPAPGVPGVATRLLLQSYAIAGEPAAGLALADEALGMGHGAELWEAEIRRLRATFLAALGAPAGEVTAELERALAVARRQQARALEQRIRETLTRTRGPPGPVVARCGASSTRPSRSTGSIPRAGGSPAPGWAASPPAAATAGHPPSTAWPVTTLPHRRRVPQLHARGRPGPRRVRRRQARPSGGAQGHLRPSQPVPAQPEHPAQPHRGGACAGLATGQ